MSDGLKVVRFDGARCVAADSEGSETIFRERRAGLIWPGAHNPGYVGIYGSSEHLDPFTGQRPIRLIQEVEEHVPGVFWQKLVPALHRWRCSAAYGDLTEPTMPRQRMFSAFLRESRTDFRTPIRDVGDYDLEATVPTVRDWFRRELVDLNERSTAYQQTRTMKPNDMRTWDGITPEQRLYAAVAMAWVVLSLEVFPIEPERKRAARVTKAGEGYR